MSIEAFRLGLLSSRPFGTVPGVLDTSAVSDDGS